MSKAQPMTAFALLNEAAARGLAVVQYADNLPLNGSFETDHVWMADEAAGQKRR